MMVKFYFDEHVPWAIVKGLRDREVDVLTIQDDMRDGGSDLAVMTRATQLGRILISVDSDFFEITAASQKAEIPFTGVISLPSKLSYRAAIDDLELIAKCSEVEEWANRITRLPLA